MKDLLLPQPPFDSPSTQLIFDLEHLRGRSITGSTPPWLFFDLKDVMHQLESLTSARIEGNRTTIMSMVEDVIEGSKSTKEESLLELRNIQSAIAFIENHTTSDTPIDRAFICELHKLVVKDLSLPPEGDGSRRPGIYRNTNNQISQSKHRPPDHTQVNGLMEELLQFINEPNAPQYDLLKTAVAHHRFAAIHPFDNGNGRTARLVTYAMLTRQRFIDEKGFRLLNPSAIFCMDRQKYYDMLAEADKGGMGNIIQWCEYVLSGIKAEIGKIDKLLDASFSIDNIILPALKLALDKKQINQVEHDVLRVAAHKSLIQVHDIQHIFGQSASDRVKASRSIKRLREQGFLMIHPKYKLKYVLRFSDNYLLRGVIQQLDVHDLLPISPNA